MRFDCHRRPNFFFFRFWGFLTLDFRCFIFLAPSLPDSFVGLLSDPSSFFSSIDLSEDPTALITSSLVDEFVDSFASFADMMSLPSFEKGRLG